MRTPEQLEAEAREWLYGKSSVMIDTPQIHSLAVWAERIQQDAVDEERKALREIVEGHLVETVMLILTKMNVTADPGTNEPKNFTPDLRTKAAIGNWLMDQRRPELLTALDARSKP